MKKMSRVLTLILALALCFSCMAVSVFADEAGNEDGEENGGSDYTFTNPLPLSDCICKVPCEGGNRCPCYYCYFEYQGFILTGTPFKCPVAKGGESAKARPFVPDVSGKYRTSMTKILATVSPVAVATAIEDNQLVIDPVTNTVGNLYDSLGNLIPCTLSSDGHFIVVPTNEGYAYIPTGK